MKRIIILITTISLLLLTSMTAYADTYYGRYGEVGDTEILQSIVDTSQEIYDYYNIDAFYFLSDVDFPTKEAAKEYADSIINEYSDVTDTVAYVRGPEAAYVVTNGYCDDIFTTEAVNRIVNITSPFEINSEYDNSAQAFFAQALVEISNVYSAGQEVPDEEMEPQPLDGSVEGVLPEEYQDDDTAGETKEADELSVTATVQEAPAKKSNTRKTVRGLIVSLILGLIVAAIVISSTKSKYKPVHKNTAASNYLDEGSVHITGSEDNFIKKETTKKDINK